MEEHTGEKTCRPRNTLDICKQRGNNKDFEIRASNYRSALILVRPTESSRTKRILAPGLERTWSPMFSLVGSTPGRSEPWSEHTMDCWGDATRSCLPIIRLTSGPISRTEHFQASAPSTLYHFAKYNTLFWRKTQPPTNGDFFSLKIYQA